MPYVVSSSRSPGAVLGVTVGHFAGTGTRYAALAKLHSIALYRIGEEKEGCALIFEQEFLLHATVKYVQAVSLHDTDSSAPVRDVLFILSVKQEVSLITFAAAEGVFTETDGVHGDAHSGSPSTAVETNRLAVVTLYHGAVDGCLYQYYPGETNLVCATPHTLWRPFPHTAPRLAPKRDSSASSSGGLGGLTPFVVFGVNRGELFVLDVLAAMGEYDRQGIPKEDRVHQYRDSLAQVRRAERVARRRLLPESLWRLASERAEGSCISRCALHSSEYEVRDVAIATAAKAGGPPSVHTSAAPGASLSLLVLFADVHGRTHISLYALSRALPGLVNTGKHARVGSDAGAYSPTSGLATTAPPFQYLEGILEGYDRRLTRSGLLVSNCDPTAAKVLLVGEAVLLIGSLLVTLITPQHGTGPLSTSGGGGSAGPSGGVAVVAPVTTELPPGLEFACACVSHITDSGVERTGSAGNAAIAVVLFKDGTVVLVPLGGGPVRRLDHKLSVIPSQVAFACRSWFIVSSRFDNSVMVDLSCASEDVVVVENVGPVLDMAVVEEAASGVTVVAATGVGKNGGVNLIRTAVTVTEHCSCTLWPLQATSVLQAHRLVAITSQYGSRFFCLESPRMDPVDLVEADAAPAPLRLSRDVAFDAALSDANIVALQYRSVASEGIYYILDSTCTLHKLSLKQRVTAAGTSLAPSWVLVSHGSTTRVADGAPRGPLPEVLFAAGASSGASVSGKQYPEADVVAISDGQRILCYHNLADVQDGEPFYDTTPALTVSCLSVTPLGGDDGGGAVLVVGDWSGRLGVVHARCGPTGSRAMAVCHHPWRFVQLAAVPRSIAVVWPALASPCKGVTREATATSQLEGFLGLRAFVGLMDGCYQEVSLGGLLRQRSRPRSVANDDDEEVLGEGAAPLRRDQPEFSPAHEESYVTRAVFIMRQPVRLVAMQPERGIILCRGPSPLLMLANAEPRATSLVCGPSGEWKSNVELTGLSLNGIVDTCCFTEVGDSLLAAQRKMPLFVFLSNYHGCHSLAVCSLPEAASKTNLTFLKLGYTVTHVRHVRQWSKFAVALRHSEMDTVAFLPDDFLDPSWRSPLSPSNSFNLLENERCVFVEPLALGSSNHRDSDDHRVGLGDAAQFVVLVGSTFAFPDEQRPRSSRITWYRRSNDNRPTEKVSKDISGQLQCCCPIPNYPGRIALGVSGCVLLFAWSMTDRTFVAEERLRIGLMVTKLIPLYGGGDIDAPMSGLAAAADGGAAVAPPTSCIAALDARFSAMLININRLQGGLEIVARDPQLRGIMDGDLVQTSSAGPGLSEELCLCDEHMNFLCMPRPVQSSDGTAEAITAQDAGGGAAGVARPPLSGRLSSEEGGVRAAPSPTATSTPAPTGGSGLVRLQPSARTHMGDLVTVMRRGSLALATARDALVPAPRSLLRGFCGEQLVFGTTHGGLGVVSPVSWTTFVVLKALECALLASSATPPGGFRYDDFREVCFVGQPRSFNRAVPLSSAESESSFAEKGTCNGDVVERFLTIRADKERAAVLRFADAVIVAALRRFSAAGEPPQELSRDVFSPASATTPADWAECNAILAADALPAVPLQLDDVETLVMNLCRTH